MFSSHKEKECVGGIYLGDKNILLRATYFLSAICCQRVKLKKANPICLKGEPLEKCLLSPKAALVFPSGEMWAEM